MPINKKDLPFEVDDHVTLDKAIYNGNVENDYVMLIPMGSHGMVRVVPNKGRAVVVEFNGTGILFGLTKAYACENLTLYRRSQHSKRRKK
jgi:hypothetical protein